MSKFKSCIASIEVGGTKVAASIGCCMEEIISNRFEVKTESAPRTTIDAVICKLREYEKLYNIKIDRIGIASFGPICLNMSDENYGLIGNTPKSGWKYFNIYRYFVHNFPNSIVKIETDVNSAALGEYKYGAATGVSNFVYITIGTGIGASCVIDGVPLYGVSHPEMGHIKVPRLPGDTFGGVCSFHGDCWEGLCCGPAIFSRANIAPEHIPADHEAWRYMTQYTASAIVNLIFTLSPALIIMGGSVCSAGLLGNTEFIMNIRESVRNMISGYIDNEKIKDGVDDYIVSPGLSHNSGLIGAMSLVV